MKPTLFIGVPRVFDRIYAGVFAKVNGGGAIKKFLFNFGYKWKLKYLRRGFAHDKVPPSRPLPHPLPSHGQVIAVRSSFFGSVVGCLPAQMTSPSAGSCTYRAKHLVAHHVSLPQLTTQQHNNVATLTTQLSGSQLLD